MGVVDHNNNHNAAAFAPQHVASPPVHAQDGGPMTTLPPTYDAARGPSTTSPVPVQQHGYQSPAPVQQQGVYHSPAPVQQGQEQGYFNPAQNNNAPQQQQQQFKHEPQLPQNGQQQQQQPGMVAAVVPLEHLDNNPQWIDCPWCQKRTHTRVEKEGSSMQMLTGVVLCLLCVCLACLPCIAGWFEDTHQFCSNCNKKVATRTHEGNFQVFRPSAGVAVPSQFPQGAVPSQYPQQAQGQQPANTKVA